MHDRISVSSICFMGTPMEELPGIWRALGARRVSLRTDQLLPVGADAARDALATGDYPLENISHMFMPGRHLSPREETWEQPREELSQLIDIVVRLGGRSIYMLTGGHGTLRWEEAAECFSAAIAPCVVKAREAGIALMIENAPPLYADFHIGHSLRDTVTLAEMAGIGVCIDLINCWTEAGLRETIERTVPRCHLVQTSDFVYGDRSYPCRAVVGDGDIPLEQDIGWILDAGYKGTFDLELLGPRIDAEGRVEAVRRTCENLGSLLEKLGA